MFEQANAIGDAEYELIDLAGFDIPVLTSATLTARAGKHYEDERVTRWSKAVAFVSYGAESGARSVEQWRQIVANFQIVDVRQQVSCSAFTEFDDSGFIPAQRRAGELTTLLKQPMDMAGKLRR